MYNYVYYKICDILLIKKVSIYWSVDCIISVEVWFKYLYLLILFLLRINVDF